MIKNWFHNWNSVLGYIWHIFGKFRLFLALFWKSWYSSNCQHHCQQGSVNLQQLVVARTEVLEKSQIFQKCAKCTLTLMSNYKINLDSTYQESMKFAFIFTCSIFLQSNCVSDNVNLKVMLKAFISDQNTDTLLRVYAQNLFFGLEPKCGFATTVSFQKAYLK